MKTLTALSAALLLSFIQISPVLAQDKAYSTDALKTLKKITPEEWKSMQEKTTARNQQFLDATAWENKSFGEKGTTVLKTNQTLNLNNEVTAMFEYTATAGQNNTGTTTARKRMLFKIGPGNFEIKDGVITRVK